MSKERDLTPDEQKAVTEYANKQAKEDHPGELVHVNMQKKVGEDGIVKGTKIRIKEGPAGKKL